MLLAAVVVAAGVTGGTVASASAAPTRQSGTWIGAIEQHGNHFDYVGRACPTEVEVCVAVEARYRITPITLEARQALPGAAGGPAELEGFLIDHHDRGHAGSLIVHRVESLAPAA
jgi:hypothetical protein